MGREPKPASITKTISHSLAIIFLVAAGVLWGWLLWPQVNQTMSFVLPELQSTLSSEPQANILLPEGSIAVYLAWPEEVHVGRSVKVELTLQPAKGSITLPDDTRLHLLAESRLDLPLLSVSPEGGIQQNIEQDDAVQFRWDLEAPAAGNYEGQFWLYMVAVDTAGKVERLPVLSVPLQIRASSLFGAPELFLIWLAVTLTAVGVIVLVHPVRAIKRALRG